MLCGLLIPMLYAYTFLAMLTSYHVTYLCQTLLEGEGLADEVADSVSGTEQLGDSAHKGLVGFDHRFIRSHAIVALVRHPEAGLVELQVTTQLRTVLRGADSPQMAS